MTYAQSLAARPRRRMALVLLATTAAAALLGGCNQMSLPFSKSEESKLGATDAIGLRASVGEDSVLFATEPEEPAQQVLLDGRVDLQADVLKVPHHGAATSIEPFFDAVHAQVAIVSVGPNTYGHPVPEVLDWIRATGAEIHRTDHEGTITVSFSDQGVPVASAT